MTELAAARPKTASQVLDSPDMVIGVLRVRMGVFAARTLKDKRRVTKSIKDRLGARHNVSIAEIDDLEHCQAATMGVAMIANDSRFVQSALSKIVDELRVHPEASLIDFAIDLL